MRVTFNTFPDSLVGQLNTLAAQQNLLQNQVATGQRISQLEDDPATLRQVLNMQFQATAAAQYGKNIDALKEQATSSYDAIQGLKTVSDRAGEIATLADGTKSPQQLQTYAAEVDQLLQQTVQFANSTYQGDYLFGGTRTDQPPFATTTNAAGQITSVNYQGNTDVAAVEISSGVTLSARIPGANATGSGPRGLLVDSRSGADLFSHLIALRDHLLAGDTASIAGSDRANLGRDEDNLVFQVGNNGLTQSHLETAATLVSTYGSAMNQQVSQEAGADLAETLVRLNETQTAYQAALQGSSRLLQTSLLDYLQ